MMKDLLANSYLFGGNAPFVEELYEAYLDNPQSVPEEWREYFDRMQVLPGGAGRDVAHAPIVESFAQRARQGTLHAAAAPAERREALVAKYRESGLTQAAYCRQHGLNATTFSGWLRRYRAVPEGAIPGLLPIQLTPVATAP
jgi:2-oxoglutarate dehydrogenase complex dehydrogenase (E1) component-like enzyme